MQREREGAVQTACANAYVRQKKKDSCVQVSEVKKIRVGRSKNIFILDFFFHYKCRGFNRRQGSGGQLLSAHCID